MVTQDFRNMMNNVPFQPFALVMSSGERVEVRHPELASMTRTSIRITEVRPDGRLTDEQNYYSLLHVTKIEFLDQSQPAEAGQNGTSS